MDDLLINLNKNFCFGLTIVTIIILFHNLYQNLLNLLKINFTTKLHTYQSSVRIVCQADLH